jgi:AcrR family transcriptional regulator
VNNITADKCIECTSALDAILQEVHNLQVTSEPTESLRERQTRERRASIHAAAVELVFEHGLDEVTVARIAEAAEVSTRTFFNYFPTKEMAIVGLTISDDVAADLQRFIEEFEPRRERLVEDLVFTIRAAFEFLLPRSANKQKLRAIQARHPQLGMLSMETKRHYSEQIITGIRRRVEHRGVVFPDDETAARGTRMLAQLCSIPLEHAFASARFDTEHELDDERVDQAFTSSVELFLTLLERLK